MSKSSAKPVQLKFFADSGHGWYAVKFALCAQLDILGAISCYSYRRGETIYLEEDSDILVLLKAFRNQGIQYEIKQMKHCDRSPIRSYHPYQPRMLDISWGKSQNQSQSESTKPDPI